MFKYLLKAVRNTAIGFAIGYGVVSGIMFAAGYLTAQQTGPAQVNGCIYHSATITLTNLQSSAFLCDINGRLKVTTTP